MTFMGVNMAGNLSIVCVKAGRMYHACYANILYDMVKRNLPTDLPFTFQCFTDDPSGISSDIIARELPDNLKGWWNKLYLFKEGVFEKGERIVYFDLDTLITGSLSELAHYQGEFTILRDFYRPNGYCSAVMFWRAGACDDIWNSFNDAGRPDLIGGDQAWIERVCQHAERLQDIFPAAFASFKVDCNPLPPQDTRVVSFHGEPKQDNCNAPWVQDIWKIGGSSAVAEDAMGEQEERRRQMQYASALTYPWLSTVSAHEQSALIIGNGESLRQSIDDIRNQEKQMVLFATGGASLLLEQNQIRFDAHILMQCDDPKYTSNLSVQYYCACTCSFNVFSKARYNIVLWNPDDLSSNASTTGLAAIRIAFTLGYRKLHLIGFDGCYLSGQRRRDEERITEIIIDEQIFCVTPWMITQAREFVLLADEMVRKGCTITVHGDGLIPYISKKLVVQ
jgi:hypothetical protein